MKAPPQIVVLDGYTLTHGDLSWEALDSLGQCTIYDRSNETEVLSRSADADIVLTNKVLFSRETYQSAPAIEIHWRDGDGEQCGRYCHIPRARNRRDKCPRLWDAFGRAV